MDLAEVQCRADDLDFLDIALERPETIIIRSIGSAAAELVEGDDPVPITG